jgi:predicted amidohydrolase
VEAAVKVAAVQHDIAWEDKQATIAHLAPLVAEAAAEGARLVVLAEMFSTGFSMRTDVTAEPEGGPSSQFLVDQAARHGVWVCGSCPEIAADADAGASQGAAGDVEARPHNTLVLAGPDGTVHRYRKRHRFTYAGVDRAFAAGSELATIEIEGVRVSPFVCYDLRFADDWWALAPQTDLYLCVANWPDSRRAHWSALLRARAIENQAYVVGCNRIGTGGSGRGRTLTYVGDSVILDPMGEALATGGDTEQVLVAEVTPERVAEVRAAFPFLADRG